MEYLLGIDLGTSGTKTVLFDMNGSAVASATVEYPFTSRRTAGRNKILLTGGKLQKPPSGKCFRRAGQTLKT